MTGMLASVNNLAEAKLVLTEQVNIIDLKEPASGALGGLDPSLVKHIVAFVNEQCPVSATIGDLPMQPELIFNAVKAMLATGVDYVKIGFFAGAYQEQVIEKLAPLASHSNLIAVLFADSQFSYRLIDQLVQVGFKGIMLDTEDKTKGSLTTVRTLGEIEHFVDYVKSRQAMCGLAGSLALEDIPILMSYRPDYLGFRGALCDQHKRTGQLNIESIQTLKRAITTSS